MHGSAPVVPFHDLGTGGAAALLQADRERADRLLDIAERRYLGRLPIRIADRLSRDWLARAGNPYLGEIDEIARQLGRPGAHMLNLSFEWACTVSVGPDPEAEGARLLRALDWDLGGLGDNLVVGRHEGPAGPWLNVGWPGFVGALTVLAPGRFAAAINQPPMRTTKIGPFHTPLPWDWLAARATLLRSTALPPVHLLRRVCDTAASYDEARRILMETPVCLPVFYTLCGLDPDEGCVIERLEESAFCFPAPACAANHWQTPGQIGRPRTRTSPQRHAALCGSMASAAGLEWLVPPVLNETTRLGVVANPRTGRLIVQGVEANGPVTAPTTIMA